jgi:hypothetical protein
MEVKMIEDNSIINAIEDSFVDYLKLVAENGSKPFLLKATSLGSFR